MFLHLSVILFTGEWGFCPGEGGLCPGEGDLHPREGGLCPGEGVSGRSLSRGVCQGDPPLPYGYKRVVPILLECILVAGKLKCNNSE